MLAQS